MLQLNLDFKDELKVAQTILLLHTLHTVTLKFKLYSIMKNVKYILFFLDNLRHIVLRIFEIYKINT